MSFALDGGVSSDASVSFPPPLFDLGVASNQQLYSASSLSPGEHTLVMTASADNVFFLDYVLVTGFQISAAVASTGTATSATSGSSSASSTGLSQAIVKQSHTYVRALAGGLCGAMVVIAIVVLLLFSRHRRRVASLRHPRAMFFADDVHSSARE